MRSVPIMCATLSNTVQPGHSVGVRHCSAVRSLQISEMSVHTSSNRVTNGSAMRARYPAGPARVRACETRVVPESVTFYFDPMCPYAYQSSMWIREVRETVGLDITWRFFSLEEVNLVEGKAHPWERPWSYGFGQMRVGALIRRELGNDALDRWYAAVGTRSSTTASRRTCPSCTRR